jgi:antagonist of KipI
MITVQQPGLLTTVQDLGRPGYQQYGVVVGGALDALAARTANLLVGNEENAAVLEMAQTGPALCFAQSTLVAWCGADFDAQINDEPCLRDRPVRVAAGDILRFGLARRGLRAWLAIAGGIDVPLVMGSRSTYRRAGWVAWRDEPYKALTDYPADIPPSGPSRF